MTVGELIEALKDMPPEREVLTEGCDCWGVVSGVAIVSGNVLITRPDGDVVNDR